MYYFFDIPLLYYYTNLNSSIICCLCSGDIYIFLLIFLFHPNLSLNAILLKYFVEILKYLSFYQLFYCQSNHQLFLQFFQLLFLEQFHCLCCKFLSTIKKFLTILIAHIFLQVIKFQSLLHLSLGARLIFIMAILFND